MSTYFRPRAYQASAPPSPVRPGSSRQTIRAIPPSPSQSLSDGVGRSCAHSETAEDEQQAAIEQQDAQSKSEEEVDVSKRDSSVNHAKDNFPQPSPVRPRFWTKSHHYRKTRLHNKDGSMSHDDDEADSHHESSDMPAECPDTPTPMTESQRRFAYLPLGTPIPFSHSRRLLGTRSDAASTPTRPTTATTTTADNNHGRNTPTPTHNSSNQKPNVDHTAEQYPSCNIAHSLDLQFAPPRPPPQGSAAATAAAVGPKQHHETATCTAKTHTQSTHETTQQQHRAALPALHQHQHQDRSQRYNITTTTHHVPADLASPHPSPNPAFASAGATAATAQGRSIDAQMHDYTSLHHARLFAPSLAPLNTTSNPNSHPDQHEHSTHRTSPSSPYSPHDLGRHTSSSRISSASAGTSVSRRSVFSTPGRDELERKKALVEADDGPFGTVASMADLEERRRGIGSRVGFVNKELHDGGEEDGGNGRRKKKKRFWNCAVGVRMRLRRVRGCSVM
ncbi:hypothetical protein ACJQWK_07861 [Exserohilum turcicum]|uniref:Uncharacterized protein n=1 Tax=Exserohilum turcicum (strain 28A) TaxID=671987 RepID=R0IZF7_EXST2|nr:uncharacterized protein SETTUDRAFT_25388 [Exserohilum turcica Et28A]EOA90100.1 hypothetical protein SETTUDRAFT_25388 [Exserohilum turcica Et28A]